MEHKTASHLLPQSAASSKESQEIALLLDHAGEIWAALPCLPLRGTAQSPDLDRLLALSPTELQGLLLNTSIFAPLPA